MNHDENERRRVEQLRNTYLDIKRRRQIKFRIPKKVRFPLVFVIFFTFVGFIQQSIENVKFDFISFIGINYLNWFKSFGDFSTAYMAEGYMGIVYQIVAGWYYFFISGGLLSLLWAIIYLIVTFEGRKDPWEIK